MNRECPILKQAGPVLVLDGSSAALRRLVAATCGRSASAEGAEACPLRESAVAEAERGLEEALGRLCRSEAAERQGELYRHVQRMVDRCVIENSLRRSEGCQVRAAEILGMSRNTLRSKMRELGLRSEDYA